MTVHLAHLVAHDGDRYWKMCDGDPLPDDDYVIGVDTWTVCPDCMSLGIDIMAAS